MPSTVLPISVYPTAIDTDVNLFSVYNTSETVLAASLNSWDTTITIFPVTIGKPEIWADSGYVTIEGELIYYKNVALDTNGKVYQFLNCIRRVNGTAPRNFGIGTDVRGFVIAEHHNNLVRAIANIENFIGTIDTTVQDTIWWKLQYINSLAPFTDDAGCPQTEFYYFVTSSNPITGTTISYNLNIIGNYTGFTIAFGDGTTENAVTSGTHSYPPNKKVDPVVTVTSTDCDVLQTNAERVTINDLQGDQIASPTVPVIIPPIPDFPNFDLAVVNPVANNIQFPPIVMPCLDIGPFGPIVVPSTISIINPYPIPSVIKFTDVPNFPSVITINNNGAIPSSISIIGTLPSNITVSPNTISLIGPSTISVIGIPSTIQVNDIDINLALNSDYCTVCTNQLSAAAPATVGGNTGVGCQVCQGANQKITKVTVVVHDFFVQSFTNTQYSRYDLIKLLLVGPDGNTCLLMGGAAAGARSTPQFVMSEPVTLTFDDASSNNIYNFSQPLKTGTYYPNANGNNLSRTAGQVNMGTPAPAPSGFNGYGTSLAVFSDTNLKTGPWSVYMSVGPASPTFTNLAYMGSVCARVTSSLDDTCPATPPPTPSGQTVRPTDPPTATPRRSNPPTATPTLPPATQPPTETPNESGGGGFGPGGPPAPPSIVPIRPVIPRPPFEQTPTPTRAPRPSYPPTPTPNCGMCAYQVKMEDCGGGICTYYWNFATNSWGRCAECQNCTGTGTNCSCPEARWMVSFGKLPVNGASLPAQNTNCQKFTWTNDILTGCGGWCTYYFTPATKSWAYESSASYCDGGTGCECLDPDLLVLNGLLVADPGTNKTEHLSCYTISSNSSCRPDQCECPPAPTLQAIVSSTQVLNLNCKALCGECMSVWYPDLANPCDPLTTDTTCRYTFSMAGGWQFDYASSSCGCENMRCLTVDEALEAGLLPEVGDTKILSCYSIGWDQLGGCNPEADPPCECPPVPTDPPGEESPVEDVVVDACIRPTPTPTPSAGCGDCYFEYNALPCGNGRCVYTYRADLETWIITNECTGTGNCDCTSVEDAIFAGWFPSSPVDGETVEESCYDFSGTGGTLVGTWQSTGNDCSSSLGCSCPAETPPVAGAFPGQNWSIACISVTPTPTPTPSSSSATATPTYSVSVSASPTPSASSAGPCSGCNLTWNGGAYTIANPADDNCIVGLGCGGCYVPLNYMGDYIHTLCNASPGACSGECWYTWNGSGWDFNSVRSNCGAIGSGVSCSCGEPTGPPGPSFPIGTQAQGTCGAVLLPLAAADDWDSFEINNKTSNLVSQNVASTIKTTSKGSQKPKQLGSESVKKSDIGKHKVLPVPVTRERVKLCRHAGKKPLEMVKQNCGSCAIRKCDILGLCSHTAVIEGRDDVFCCQLCDYYEPEVALNPQAQPINAPSIKQVSEVDVSSLKTDQVSFIPETGSQSQQIPPILDNIAAAEEQIKFKRQRKITPRDSAIKVDVDDLLGGK